MKRNDFLKLMLTASVFATVRPFNLLGKLEPKLKEENGKITGIYTLSLNEYPQLTELWGHLNFKVEAIPPEEWFPNLIIVKVPYNTYDKHFTCVADRCPHAGFPMEEFDPDDQYFVCSEHGTIFDIEGKYIEGPASQDLDTFETKYDGGDTVGIEIPQIVSSDIEGNNGFFAGRVYPNPAAGYATLNIGLIQPANVRAEIYTYSGQSLLQVPSFFGNEGMNEIRMNLANLRRGAYFIRVEAEGNGDLKRNFLVR